MPGRNRWVVQFIRGSDPQAFNTKVSRFLNYTERFIISPYKYAEIFGHNILQLQIGFDIGSFIHIIVRMDCYRPTTKRNEMQEPL
ncbi:MAG: hypothetical protein Q8R70_00945, partial [Methanoregula sp.]|nr:hypothetical protein [Methanoregula sp.]